MEQISVFNQGYVEYAHPDSRRRRPDWLMCRLLLNLLGNLNMYFLYRETGRGSWESECHFKCRFSYYSLRFVAWIKFSLQIYVRSHAHLWSCWCATIWFMVIKWIILLHISNLIYFFVAPFHLSGPSNRGWHGTDTSKNMIFFSIYYFSSHTKMRPWSVVLVLRSCPSSHCIGRVAKPKFSTNPEYWWRCWFLLFMGAGIN